VAYINKLDNVQIARAIAAVMVVIEHAKDQIVNHPVNKMSGIYLPGGSTWSAGVDIFFIISGFIMVYVNYDKFGDTKNSLQFFAKRLARVAPTYWIFTIGMILASIVDRGNVRHGLGSAWHLFSSFIFIPSPRPDGMMHPILGLGWTLNYEFEFYVAFALALTLPVRFALPILVLIFTIGVAVHTMVPWPVLRFWTDPLILEFLFGVGIGLILIKGRQISSAMAVGLGLVGFVLLFGLNDDHANQFRVISCGIPSAMIVAALALAPQLKWWKPALIIGDASYAMYLCHPFCLNIATHLWKALHMPPYAFAFFCAEFVLSVIGALLTFYVLENPIQRLIRRANFTLLK
jgi:exopolysaccharide production protein ExoZ